MAETTGERHYRWAEIPLERVKEGIERRLVTGDRMMLAHIYLEKGAVVPTHAHENEQLTYVLEGALKFWLGDEDDEDGRREVVVRSGEVLHIPSGVPHRAQALENTLDVDVFSPPRRDWLDGTDHYFHDEG